jgi:ribosomal protein S18 acetylase RimI-like enzyme
MSSPSIIQDIRIVPFAGFEPTSITPIFDEQCDEWLSRLRWDYAEPSRLLRSVLRKGELTGLVAVIGAATSRAGAKAKGPLKNAAASSGGVAGGTALGFSFYVIEGTRASIGDIYVSEKYRSAGIDKELALAVLEKLKTQPRLRRIESQSVNFDNPGADQVFVSRGFERYERRFMLAHLLSSHIHPESSGLPTGGPGTIRIRPWREDDYGGAVRTIFRSYRGEDDSRINSQYGSEEGCAELLSILTDTVWCGRFLPEVSRVASCSVTGNQVGVLIASRMSADTGHLGQISVLPGYQGRGIGRLLIQSASSELSRRGFDCVSLAVTATNTRALSLYQSCGFSTIHSFPVYFWRRK